MNKPEIHELRQRFPFLTFDTEQTLPRVRSLQGGAGIELFLQGAHISRFDGSQGGSPLFMSKAANFQPGTAIRGGIPLCFPWFGPNKADENLPAHGFARTTEWQIESADQKELVLKLESDEHTLALWPHLFRANYRIGFDSNHLQVSFEVHNTGNAPFTFEVALHTYFRVQDVRAIAIDGLDGKTYLDKVGKIGSKTQQGTIYIEGETDRVYLDSPGPIILREEGRSIRLTDRGGWRSTVVWNPWIEKARALKDLDDEEWTQFVCIESGVIADDAVTVGAGDFYTLAIEIEVESSL
jgi:glucose-6-phosphate 1-epimerase